MRLYAWWQNVPRTRESFDAKIAGILSDPNPERWFMGMTYRYHADAVQEQMHDYHKIKAPMLVVCGTKDSLINSCDDFAEKAQKAEAPIDYWRVEGMEHRISQNKENLIPKSFEWLRQKLNVSRT